MVKARVRVPSPAYDLLSPAWCLFSLLTLSADTPSGVKQCPIGIVTSQSPLLVASATISLTGPGEPSALVAHPLDWPASSEEAFLRSVRWR